MGTQQHEPQSAPPRSSQEWVGYFRRNAEARAAWPHSGALTLSPWERRAIESSIAEFQLGESSEGRHLKDLARRWALRAGDWDYAHAIDLFIAEENRHAGELGAFMDAEAIGRLGHSWADRIFRGLRKLAGLELAVRVLVTAEIIAQVYYQALRDATQSSKLREICGRILEDEDPHVQFQCERLAILRRGRAGRSLVEASHWILLGGAALVVWVNHRRVLRAGRFGLVDYLREVAACGANAMRIADSARYRWPEERSEQQLPVAQPS